jgi:myo-inositol-1(or 4)-monophosphatase
MPRPTKPDAELLTLRNLVRSAACQQLVPRFAEVQRHMKLDGSLVTHADLAMQDAVREALAQHWPRRGFLGEEMSGRDQDDLLARTDLDLWCLDPLDGTSNFAAGIPFFGVSLALLAAGQVQLGVVYDPSRDECFMARHGAGAWCNDQPLTVGADATLTLTRSIGVVDFKRLAAPLAVRLAAQPPYGSQRNFGASSLEWCWLAAGRFQLYLHGGQHLWDYAAGCLILAEAGGRAETLEGEAIFQRSAAVRSVVASHDPQGFPAWAAWLRP